METSKQKLLRLSRAVCILVAIGLLAVAVLWPRVVAEVLSSRLAVSLIAAWSAGLAMLLHPELRAGLLQGIREFREALKEVARYIGGNDDDGPSAA